VTWSTLELVFKFVKRILVDGFNFNGSGLVAAHHSTTNEEADGNYTEDYQKGITVKFHLILSNIFYESALKIVL